MYELNYPRHIRSMFQEPPSEKFFCVPLGLISRRTTLKFEYLREFEAEFENVSGYELGAHMGSVHEKNQGPNISCYCTFKATKCCLSISMGLSLQRPDSEKRNSWLIILYGESCAVLRHNCPCVEASWSCPFRRLLSSHKYIYMSV
jgi:hypothetical protein